MIKSSPEYVSLTVKFVSKYIRQRIIRTFDTPKVFYHLLYKMGSMCKVLKLSKKMSKKYPSKFLQEKCQAMI